MRRWLVSLSAVALVAGFIATPVASAQQSLNLYVGGVTLRAEDARDSNDVLVQDRTFLDFNIGDFNGAPGLGPGEAFATVLSLKLTF